MPKTKKLFKPTVTIVLTVDEKITIKQLSMYLKSFLQSEGPNDWLAEHIKKVRVRSIDFD